MVKLTEVNLKTENSMVKDFVISLMEGVTKDNLLKEKLRATYIFNNTIPSIIIFKSHR